ncbi:phosphotransferase family protein [Nocardioides sp. GCM10027113]|uniref:phosphotransferase family protein n=1 Tax=unclassified Nocardioides TaxID=2615069 RepID=UPI003616A0DA
MDECGDTLSARAMDFESWDRVQPLAGGRGDSARLAWKDGRPHVVKSYGPGRLDGVRERAALEALAGRAGTPTLLAESDEPPFVVMSYLDGSGSLADALLGTDEDDAVTALLRWAEALADLHSAGTTDRREAFVEGLARRAPDLSPRSLAGDFEVAAQRYSEVLVELGLPPHYRALEDLRALPAALGDPADEVLSPADTCPDNNVRATDRLHLIDFEYAELRHPAWDVAYLRAPWPSCWCAWRLPDESAETAVAGYRRAAGTACGTDFETDLAVATLGWQAMTPALFLAGALTSDDAAAAPGRPTRRAFVLHRLAAVAANESHPALGAMAADLHGALRQRWGDVPLELAPAFRPPR